MLSHLKHLPNFSVNAVLVRGYRFWDCFTMSGLTSARGMLAMWGESCVLSLLVRTHGGARRVERRGTPMPFRVRQAEDPEAKAAIARAASELIADDDAVIFDNGTTAGHCAAAGWPAHYVDVSEPAFRGGARGEAGGEYLCAGWGGRTGHAGIVQRRSGERVEGISRRCGGAGVVFHVAGTRAGDDNV